jgi:hypothetical protein
MQETNLYTITIPPMKQSLKALAAILEKAASHAESKKTPRRGFEDALLADRIVFDQFPLSMQIQVATDNAKGGGARLAGIEPPKFEDNEKTIAEFKTRIDKTVAFLDTITSGQVAGQEARKITLPYFPDKHLTAFDYATQYLMPNFYFHVVTAYAILRKNGVPLGKADYMLGLTLRDN